MHRAAPPDARPDATGRIAALMQTAREETLRRRIRLRQYVIAISALFLIAALTWVATAILRYAGILGS